MTKNIGRFLFPFLIFLLLTGCTPIGEKTKNISSIYFACAVFALVLVALYVLFIRRKKIWYMVLFCSIFVVNSGYWLLSVSSTLQEALMANRISYLGSVLLPISMLMIILELCRFPYGKKLASLLLVIGMGVFLIAASPGLLDVYYREVSLGMVNGATVLNKVYGPWHFVYMVYLMGSFAAIIAAVIYGMFVKKIQPAFHAVMAAAAVFINIGVWLLEQLVHIDFEILSVSYILSGLFLLSLCLMMQEEVRSSKTPSLPRAQSAAPAAEPSPAETKETVHEHFRSGLLQLTPAERNIYRYYLQHTPTKEIMAQLNITENTLKYHNKNLYGKLGVTSRKQLVQIAAELEQE